ncbi:hypothetical protein M0805_006645 [Coniferiporia weirii]|nr:hypothetical protein M0805_006645 [Coniferiporia weirii]
MQFSLSFSSLVAVAVIALSTGTAASPTPAPATETLEKRTVGGVYICTDLNWEGTCGYAVQPLEECIVLGSEWSDQISSFGPDECTTCFGYEESSCSEASWEFNYPGDGSGGLSTNNPWNDNIRAFMCEKSC